MTNRTVKVLGWGVENSSAAITAILDGETVFSGGVDLQQMTADNESVQTAPTLFTFEIPVDFSGTKQMTISVSGSSVRLGQIVANYAKINSGSAEYSTGADIYEDLAGTESGISDPRGDEVVINGETQKANRLIGKGTWHWVVEPGSTLEHDLIVSTPGLVD